jgi:hypothetical protein
MSKNSNHDHDETPWQLRLPNLRQAMTDGRLFGFHERIEQIAAEATEDLPVADWARLLDERLFQQLEPARVRNLAVRDLRSTLAQITLCMAERRHRKAGRLLTCLDQYIETLEQLEKDEASK